MKIEQFIEWSYAHTLQTSPSDDFVVFQVTKPDLISNNYATNLWIYHANNSDLRQLTSLDQGQSIIFLESGDLLFASNKTPKPNASKDKQKNATTYWRINPHGGEAQFEFEVELNVDKIFELSDEKYLILGSKSFQDERNWLEIDELPFWLNGAGYTAGLRTSLYLFDGKQAKKQSRLEQTRAAREEIKNSSKIILDGKINDHDISETEQIIENNQIESGILTRITKESQNINLVDLSSDKQKLVFSSSTYDKLMPLKEDITSLDLENMKQTTISHHEYQVYALNFVQGQNTKIFLTASDGEKHGLNQDPQVYLIDLENSEIEQISQTDFDCSFGNTVGTDAKVSGGDEILVKDDDLFFISTDREKAVLKKIDQSGFVNTIIKESGAIRCFAMSSDAIYFIAMFDLKLPELYIYKNQTITQITNFSRQLAETELAEIESFQYESNGDILDGFVVKPPNYKIGNKYPALLEIHGGPKTSFGTILHHEMQFLAAQGYVIFYTNPHGSDGYGVKFSDIRGKYGTIDYQDLMNFTDIVLKKYPQIDSNRIGVIGGSYGGFMVNWIIGKSARFAAANSQRSISNWLSFYGVSDIGYYFTQDQTASNPWDNPEDSWNQSPLKYAREVKTPTLFIHSDQDLRCPLEQGMQMYSALQINQIDTKLVVFKNETHELSRSGKPKARIKRLAEINNWFNKYLKHNNELKC